MRPALIATALTALAACGGQPEAAGPERRSAAGEVLGGEVSDEMLPLESVRSTSPADPSAGATSAPADDAAPAAAPKTRPTLPRPELSGGPEPEVEPSEFPPR